MIRPQLVLDIGGVLATNLSPLFWQLLAAESRVSEDVLYGEYKQQVSEQLWTGVISEEQFWNWVKVYAPLLHLEKGRGFIERSLLPLPALAKVSEWSEAADIHLLSNHLAAWVDPIVLSIKPYLKSLTISNEVGLKKPHPDIFAKVIEKLPAGSPVLFVDDQRKNTKQAASLGWRTLLADEEGFWINEVIPILKHISEKQE